MRNLTLRLPVDLIRQAKIHAAQHDTTVNAYVRKLLEESLSRDQCARDAGDRLLELAEQGPWPDFDPGSVSRDEIHER